MGRVLGSFKKKERRAMRALHLMFMLATANGFKAPMFRATVQMRRAAATSMMVRSNWAAIDDGAPLGLLEQDASAVFDMLDEDGSGVVSQEEMSSRLLACDYSQERIDNIFGKIDVDGSKEIDLSEWQSAYIKYPSLRTAPGLGGALKLKLHAEADALFGMLDDDGNGTISDTELRDYLVDLGYASEFADTVLRSVDADKSGEIDNDELRLAFLKHPSIRAPGCFKLDPNIGVVS